MPPESGFFSLKPAPALQSHRLRHPVLTRDKERGWTGGPGGSLRGAERAEQRAPGSWRRLRASWRRWACLHGPGALRGFVRG